MGDLYLVHHGIKGQQWGVRNGPPYPLSDRQIEKYKKKRKNATLDRKNYENRLLRAQMGRDMAEMNKSSDPALSVVTAKGKTLYDSIIEDYDKDINKYKVLRDNMDTQISEIDRILKEDKEYKKTH